MSIEKDIAIHHSSGVQNVVNYIEDPDKTILTGSQNRSDVVEIDNVLDYAQNIEKTLLTLDGHQDILVSGIHCTPELAPLQFQMDRDRYYFHIGRDKPRGCGTYVDKNTGEVKEKQSIECHHVIQSFAPDIENLDPRVVHEIGKEYARRSFPGHRCVVSTHMDKHHLHNHIVVCAYHSEENRKICMNQTFRHKIRRINDDLSVEYGLPILLDADIDHKSTISKVEWNALQEGASWKNRIRKDIEVIASLSHSWKEFREGMEKGGYIVNDTKKSVLYTTTLADGRTRKIRDKTLGEFYTRAQLITEYEMKDPVYEKKWGQPVFGAYRRHKRDRIEYRYDWQKKKEFKIVVRRYTPDGRRRSDLEMILMFAIKLIRYFKDRFMEWIAGEQKPDPVHRPYQQRIQTLESAVYLIRKHNIEDEKQLKEELDKTGAELAHVKKEIQNIDEGTEQYWILDERLTELKRKYRDLKRIQAGHSLALSEEFTHGLLYNKALTQEETVFLDPQEHKKEEKPVIKEEPEEQVTRYMPIDVDIDL